MYNNYQNGGESMNHFSEKFPKKNGIIIIVCLGIFFTFIFILSKGILKGKYAVALLAAMALLMPIFLAWIVRSIRICIAYVKFKNIMQYGRAGTCQIVDYKTVIKNKKWNIRFALILKYYENHQQKTYKTGYDYLGVEYRYLSSLEEIQCKIKDNKVLITEKIPDEIYENLTVYGIEPSKFRRHFIILWQYIGWIGAVLLLAGIVATILAEDSLYLIIGVLCLFIPTTICAFIFGIHFFITVFILKKYK